IKRRKAQLVHGDPLESMDPMCHHPVGLFRGSLVSLEAGPSRDPKMMLSIGREIVKRNPVSPLAIKIFERKIRLNPSDNYAWNFLADIYQNLGDKKSAEGVLRAFFASESIHTWTINHLVEVIASDDRVDEAIGIIESAISAGLTNHHTEILHERLKAGWVLSPPDAKPKSISEDDDDVSESSESIDPLIVDGLVLLPQDISSSGELKRIRFVLDNNIASRTDQSLIRLRELLASDFAPEYARMLSIRYGIWDGDGEELTDFASAFEFALSTRDMARLERLSIYFPRLARNIHQA
ncbi:MAG: hypothetical protein SH859_05485, partial [Hyphomicrobium aestuarii]|nr:hypothetical protein [Hyphomicrobium aestuarii]